jgi:chromosome segregation protein
VIGAERKLAEAREQLRALERQAQEAQFQPRWRRAAASCSAHRDRAAAGGGQRRGQQLQDELDGSTTPPPRPACRTRWR